MSDIEIVLANLGEIAARDIATLEKPSGFNENVKVARRGVKKLNFNLVNLLPSVQVAQSKLRNLK